MRIRLTRSSALWRERPLLVVDVDQRMGWSSDGLGDRLLVAQTADGSQVGLVAQGQLRLLRLPIEHRLSELSLENRSAGMYLEQFE